MEYEMEFKYTTDVYPSSESGTWHKTAEAAGKKFCDEQEAKGMAVVGRSTELLEALISTLPPRLKSLRDLSLSAR